MHRANNQAELNQLLENYGEAEVSGGIYIVTRGFVYAGENSQITAWGNSQVTARENSQVTTWENSQVTAWENSQVTARENSQVTARGSSQVTAWENSQVTAWENSEVTVRENSQVTAWGNSEVTAWGNSQVTARENSQVTAWENSQVTAWGNSQVTAWENSQVTAKGLAFAIVRSPNVIAKGNFHIITYPKSIEEWCERNLIEINNGKFLVYKATDINYQTQDNFKYTIGKIVTDPQWNPSTGIECGFGLHFCYDPIACEQFNDRPGHYLLCEVDVKNVAFFKGTPVYPAKIRAKSCKVICEVDRNGNRITSKPKRDSKGRFIKA